MSDPELRFHPRDDSPFYLGHGLAAVGPGWWALVRLAFAEVEARGCVVERVRQKLCLLDVLARQIGGAEESLALRDRFLERSRYVCEVCGGPAPAAVMPRDTRTHCSTCASRWQELGWGERALWMEHAGVWLPEWRGG